jgi:Peroxidase, family 2
MATPGPTSSSSKEIDYTHWTPPGPTDVRSPCPMLNALANHSILPHTGRSITKTTVIDALHNAINLDPSIGKVFAAGAVITNPAHAGLGQLLHETDDWTFDLDTVGVHGVIEHDCSLSRQDFKLGGDATTFDESVWDSVIAHYDGKEETDFHTASKARYERLQAATKAHEAAGQRIQYGLKEAVMSYGETALWMSHLGDPKEGKIPVEYLKTLFGKFDLY